MVECKICQEEGEECEKKAPCGCNGTLKFAYGKCISEMVQQEIALLVKSVLGLFTKFFLTTTRQSAWEKERKREEKKRKNERKEKKKEPKKEKKVRRRRKKREEKGREEKNRNK